MDDRKGTARNLLLLYGLSHYLSKRIDLLLRYAMRLRIRCNGH